ncbi:MAG: YbhN family protein [Gaiella sp.]
MSGRPDEGLFPDVDWRRVAFGGVLAVVVGAGVVFLIGRAAGLSVLKETLREGSLGWLAVCAAGQLAVFLGYAGVFRGAAAFEDGVRISGRLSLRVTLASFGLTQLVAAGGAAALAITYWGLRRLGFDREDAAVRLIGLNTLVYAVFGVIGWVAALVALIAGEAPLAMTLPWLAGIPVLVLAARWFTAPGRVERWTKPARSWSRRGLAVGVGAAWWTRRALAARSGRGMEVSALAYWVGDLASLWGGLRAFDADPGLAALALVYATGYLAQSVPLPFIATGGVDAATTFALTAVGIPLESALAGVIAHRVFAFWLPLVPGLLLAARLPETGRRLRAARLPATAR